MICADSEPVALLEMKLLSRSSFADADEPRPAETPFLFSRGIYAAIEEVVWNVETSVK